MIKKRQKKKVKYLSCITQTLKAPRTRASLLNARVIKSMTRLRQREQGSRLPIIYLSKRWKDSKANMNQKATMTKRMIIKSKSPLLL